GTRLVGYSLHRFELRHRRLEPAINLFQRFTEPAFNADVFQLSSPGSEPALADHAKCRRTMRFDILRRRKRRDQKAPDFANLGAIVEELEMDNLLRRGIESDKHPLRTDIAIGRRGDLAQI